MRQPRVPGPLVVPLGAVLLSACAAEPPSTTAGSALGDASTGAADESTTGLHLDPARDEGPGPAPPPPPPPDGTGTTTGDPSDDATTGEPPTEPAWPAFEDVSALAGVDAPHAAKLGHHAIGQAWGDYDRDGWLDLYVTGGVGPSVLYHNEGDGTFTVSPLSPTVALVVQATAGAAWGDYDNDGWLDLYVTCDGRNVLFHNEAGLGFVDRTNVAGVWDDRYGVMAAWGDYDEDGWIDLYVANHGGDHDMFYRNEGDGTFSDVGPFLGTGVYGHTRAAFAATFLD
ncbi:MAG: VCBS repeat-containing protein [Myxococcales bacterium]|nr:VCBS repeat-containing protein [Myxococcales bacterium]